MPNADNPSKHQLRVSSYDRVSSWLVSSLVVVGVTVGGLVFIFLTRQLLSEEVSVPITINTGGGGTGGSGGPLGTGQDFELGVDESADASAPEFQDTLSAVANAVATKSAVIADETIDDVLEPSTSRGAGDRRTPGSGGGYGGGHGGGIGSGFGPGRGGTREPQREVRFEPASVNEYAQWLDYFKIELGLLGRDNKVYYAYNLSRPKPEVRVGDPADEQRLYMNPAVSHFAALDRELAVKAGIADKGQIILHFYPPEAQAIIYTLEQERAGGRKPEQIRRTVFRVTRTGDRFVFSVEEQFYR